MASRSHRKIQFPIAALALTIGVAASPARAQEWTQFRGPNGTGTGKGTALPIEAKPETTLWKADLPGTGHSSPVLWGTKLFVTSAEDMAGKRHVLCLNATDGKQIWDRSFAYTPYRHHKFNSAAASTPAVDKERVYLTWGNQENMVVSAIDHSGKDVWTRDMGPYLSQHGGACSPMIAGDLLIIRVDSDEMGPESYIAALDCKTGVVRWKVPRQGKSASYSVPVLHKPEAGPNAGKDLLILTSNGQGMTAMELKTGAIAWEMPGLFKQRCVSVPVLYKGLVFATSGDGAGARQGIAIRPDGTAGKIEYQVGRGVPYVPSPIIVGDLMFLWGDAGVVTCVKADSGEQVWMERVGGNFFGSPVAADGKLFAIDTRGELVVLAAGPEYKLLARTQLGEASNATPAIANGALYLRTESHIICLGKKP